MKDLAGLGKIAEVILDKVAAVTGTLYEPTKVRRLGCAEAELILKTTVAGVVRQSSHKSCKHWHLINKSPFPALFTLSLFF